MKRSFYNTLYLSVFFISLFTYFGTASAMNYPKGNFDTWNQSELFFGSNLAIINFDDVVNNDATPILKPKTGLVGVPGIPNGTCLLSRPLTPVTLDEFKCFVDKIVTPRFPYGLTWFPANGQYYFDPNNVLSSLVKEQAYAMIIFYPASTSSNMKLEEIRTLYLNSFGQSSVLRTDLNAKVSF